MKRLQVLSLVVLLLTCMFANTINTKAVTLELNKIVQMYPYDQGLTIWSEMHHTPILPDPYLGGWVQVGTIVVDNDPYPNPSNDFERWVNENNATYTQSQYACVGPGDGCLGGGGMMRATVSTSDPTKIFSLSTTMKIGILSDILTSHPEISNISERANMLNTTNSENNLPTYPINDGNWVITNHIQCDANLLPVIEIND